MRIGSYEIDNKWLMVGGAILTVILIFIFLSIPSCQKPVTPQQTLNDALIEAKKPLLAQIATQQQQITDYRNKLTVSEGKYKVLVKRYADLQKEKEDVKPPTTNAELRARFTALGFPPLPAK